MKIQVCVRCKKRPAVVFITRLDGGKSINEGLCFQCAAELGIKPPPVMDMLKKMGVDEDDLKGMSEELDSMMENALVESNDEAEENGKIPTLNLSEIFGMPEKRSQDNDGDSNKKRSDGKKAGSEKKLLSPIALISTRRQDRERLTEL